MTAWTPVWAVSIDGGTYTPVTLANLSIGAGRTDIYHQPTASYCSIELVNTDQSSFAIDINNSITLQVKNSSGTYVTIFGGFVTDIEQSVKTAGSQAIVQTYKITALGALSKLPKSITEGVLSKALDGAQILSILTPILINSWNEVAPADTWATYNATQTWATAENVGLGEIDTGDYELTDRTSSDTDAYSLISALANSGLGYIYEDSAGRICYADSTHRVQYLSLNGYTTLSANDALARGISATRKIGDIRNKIKLSYKANATVSAQDDLSIGIYGVQAQNITTSLENSADATSQAAFWLALRANPQDLFKSITFELSNPELSDATRNALIAMFMGLPVQLTNLPANMVGGQFEGFVEGWSFSAGFNKLSITLIVSPVSYSIQYAKWSDTNAAETWSTIVPTLQWLNATIAA